MADRGKLIRLLAALGADDPQDLSKIAHMVAQETTFNVLYRLADPDSDDLQPDLRKELPGWVLVETTTDGTPTHRPLNALHEDLLALAPTDDD